MAAADERPSRCVGCGTPLEGAPTVDVTIRAGDRERTTVLCEECATVDCRSCGSAVPVASALVSRDDIWEQHDLFECTRCEESVTGPDIVELRHENDPSYRKQVCSDCLQEIPIPSNIRVVRDVAKD